MSTSDLIRQLSHALPVSPQDRRFSVGKRSAAGRAEHPDQLTVHLRDLLHDAIGSAVLQCGKQGASDSRGLCSERGCLKDIHAAFLKARERLKQEEKIYMYIDDDGTLMYEKYRFNRPQDVNAYILIDVF